MSLKCPPDPIIPIYQKKFNEHYHILFFLSQFNILKDSSFIVFNHQIFYSHYITDRNQIFQIDIRILPSANMSIAIDVCNNDFTKITRLRDAYEVYRFLLCNNDDRVAMNWESDTRIQIQYTPMTQNQRIIYQHVVLPPPPYNYTILQPQIPHPTFDLDFYLNQEFINYALNLKLLLLGSTLERIAEYLSKKHNIPESTIILVG